MHVVFIDNICIPQTPGVGGHSDIIWAMAKELVALNVRVSIVGPYQSQTFPFQHPGLKVYAFQAAANPDRNGVTRIIHVIKSLAKLNKIGEIDVIHVTDAFSAGVASVFKRKIPVVFTTSGNILQRQSSSAKLDVLSSAFYYVVSYLATKNVARIIATSYEMKVWWVKTGASDSQISVIPLGISDKSCQAEEVLYSLPFRILFVGRLVPENNPEHLIPLWELLSRHPGEYHLTIIGDGPLKERIHRRLENFPNVYSVEFLGTMSYDELQQQYSKHHLLIVTREAGATPRVAIEALSNNLPVIAFTGSGLEDYLDNYSQEYVVEHSVPKMAAKIDELRRNPKRYTELENGIAEIRLRTHTWSMVCRQIMTEVYEPLLMASNTKKSK